MVLGKWTALKKKMKAIFIRKLYCEYYRQKEVVNSSKTKTVIIRKLFVSSIQKDEHKMQEA